MAPSILARCGPHCQHSPRRAVRTGSVRSLSLQGHKQSRPPTPLGPRAAVVNTELGVHVRSGARPVPSAHSVSGRGQESPSLDPTSHQLQWPVSLATENLAGGGFGGRGTQLPCVRSRGRAPSGAAGSAARPRCSVLLALRSAKGVWAQKSLWMSLVTQAQPVHSQCSHHDTRLAWPLISRRPGSPSRQATGQEWDGTVSRGFGTNRGTGEGQPSSLKSVLFSQKSRQPQF